MFSWDNGIINHEKVINIFLEMHLVMTGAYKKVFSLFLKPDISYSSQPQSSTVVQKLHLYTRRHVRSC